MQEHLRKDILDLHIKKKSRTFCPAFLYRKLPDTFSYKSVSFHSPKSKVKMLFSFMVPKREQFRPVGHRSVCWSKQERKGVVIGNIKGGKFV